MSLDALPLWILFAITVAIVMLSIEAGYRLGMMAHQRSEDEKEPAVSNVTGAVLGLVAFLLAFTFGIVWGRYDDRKTLVREEANAIRTALARSDFLPDQDRAEAKRLLGRYLDARIAAVQPELLESARVQASLADAVRIQRRLWAMAVTNAKQDMNSDVAALYIESLNEVVAVHASRISVGMQARIPLGIWWGLYGLTVFAMMGIGYHTGIAASRRSISTLLLAISFALVISLIATLDRPIGLIRVSQQPLVNLQQDMANE